jgi:hypothetical protein
MSARSLFCLLLGSLLALAEDSLPPLRDGKVPQNLTELWGDYDPRKEPLADEVLKEWEKDGIVYRVVRYQVGVFKGQPVRIAAFYACPKGAVGLPALLHIHGGGQSASLASVVTDAKHGYASLSLNWGGNKMTLADGTAYDGPGTDWGALDATHPPQRNKVNHFAGGTAPDAFTLDAVDSPRNDNWFLVTLAARRGLTYLERRPEANRERLGVYGHSMGGRLTTQLTGIDKRVRAAAPSCGGSGDLLATPDEMPGGQRSKATPLALACTSENPYIARLSVPILWISPTNDFHAHMDNMAWNWRNVPEHLLRLSISPHLNHRHDDASALAQHMWFETHLVGRGGLMPEQPAIRIEAGPVTRVVVTPESLKPNVGVRIYVTQDPHELSRFWRSLPVRREGAAFAAIVPLLDLSRPLFAFANVSYATPEEYGRIATAPGVGNSPTYQFSTRETWVTAEKLRANGAVALDQPDRLVSADSGDLVDWYLLNRGHAALWSLHTRKPKDPKWRGPDGAKLTFRIAARTEDALVVKLTLNDWGAFGPGPKTEYAAHVALKPVDGWADVEVAPADFAPLNGVKTPLKDWSTLTELTITPVVPAELKAKGASTGQAWSKGTEPRIKELRWIGGSYATLRGAPAELNDADRTKSFNNAIKESLEK